MIILITGTPGTGKTTASKLLAERVGAEIVHITDFATDDVTEGMEGGTKIVDVEKLEQKIKNRITGDAVIDGHLSSHLGLGNLVIVLRTDPKVLESRLEEKGFDEKKIKENLEAEALDVCLIESMERHKAVFEIDTTDKNPEDVVEYILKIINGEGGEFIPGKIDWSEIFF
jgi:adenylate kinase